MEESYCCPNGAIFTGLETPEIPPAKASVAYTQKLNRFSLTEKYYKTILTWLSLRLE